VGFCLYPIFKITPLNDYYFWCFLGSHNHSEPPIASTISKIKKRLKMQYILLTYVLHINSIIIFNHTNLFPSARSSQLIKV